MKQHDNATVERKIYLRRKGLERLRADPIVMETHGGFGSIYRRVYDRVRDGVVIERDLGKAAVLVQQRPSWSVYCANSDVVVQWGAGNHLAINFLDVDPYGDPWPTIAGFFGADRPFADHMVVAVNDGLRAKVRFGGAWSAKSLAHVVEDFGNNLWPIYLQVCRRLMEEAVARAGYKVAKFQGYYCGQSHNKNMTHYLAELAR